jgi:predicted dithiol-disulfide oxidoreductase (DUF899 family)
MGWSFPWVSSANSEFNVDLGFSSSEEQTREWVAPMLEQLPPIAARNASETSTDVVRYLTESPGFSSFVLDDGAAYHTYSTGARGVEFLMGYLWGTETRFARRLAIPYHSPPCSTRSSMRSPGAFSG